MNDKPTEKTISDLPVITKFIYSIGVLPTSYKMSMTYEEQVVWLCNYLETTVIPAVNQNGEAVEELQNLYELLRTYVNDYFDNLDVQEEINNKLEQMAEDGSLYNIIRQYTDPIVNQQNEEIASFKNEVNDSIDEINTNVNVIDNKVDEIANGSPLVASSTAGMTDTTKIYVNTTDGKWYWYDGDSWEIGGTYQSAGIADNSLNYYMLDSELQTNLKLNDYSRGELTIIGNYYNGSVGSAISQTQFNTAESGVMNVVKDDIVVIPFVGRTNNYGTIPAIVLTDENDIVKEKITFATLVESVVTNNTPYMFRVGANVRKVYFNNNIIENVSAYHMRWYPYKVNSFNYMDSRVTYNMDNYTILSPSDTETGVFYSQDQWAKELEGYRTLKYNVSPLEKIHVDSIIPVNHLRAIVNVGIDVVVNTKIINLSVPQDSIDVYIDEIDGIPVSVKTKSRVTALTQAVISLLNGAEVAGVGKMIFSREQSIFNQAQYGIWNNRNYEGIKIVMGVSMSGVS